jgi:hypothetical protein
MRRGSIAPRLAFGAQSAGAGEARCRIVDHLSLPAWSGDRKVAEIYLSFRFARGLSCGFACPTRKHR